MITLLLIVHIAGSILFIGPTTLATSVFARYAGRDTLDVARAMHSVSRTYGTAALVVPAAGFVLAAQEGVLARGWVLLAIGLFVVALAILGAVIVPAQARALDAIETGGDVPDGTRTTLRVSAGLYAAAWVAILALMVAKPF